MGTVQNATVQGVNLGTPENMMSAPWFLSRMDRLQAEVFLTVPGRWIVRQKPDDPTNVGGRPFACAFAFACGPRRG